MGRRKISIAPISDDRNRQVTFLKRKNGLFKKAYELGVLCSADVAVVVFNANGKLFEFHSGDMDTILLRYSHYAGPPHEKRGPQDYINKDLLAQTGGAAGAGGKSKMGGKMTGDEDDEDDEGFLEDDLPLGGEGEGMEDERGGEEGGNANAEGSSGVMTMAQHERSRTATSNGGGQPVASGSGSGSNGNGKKVAIEGKGKQAVVAAKAREKRTGSIASDIEQPQSEAYSQNPPQPANYPPPYPPPASSSTSNSSDYPPYSLPPPSNPHQHAQHPQSQNPYSFLSGFPPPPSMNSNPYSQPPLSNQGHFPSHFPQHPQHPHAHHGHPHHLPPPPNPADLFSMGLFGNSIPPPPGMLPPQNSQNGNVNSSQNNPMNGFFGAPTQGGGNQFNFAQGGGPQGYPNPFAGVGGGGFNLPGMNGYPNPSASSENQGSTSQGGGGVPNWFGSSNPMLAALAQQQTAHWHNHNQQQQHQQRQQPQMNEQQQQQRPTSRASNTSRQSPEQPRGSSSGPGPTRQDSTGSTLSASASKPRLVVAIPKESNLEEGRKKGLVTAGGASILGKGFEGRTSGSGEKGKEGEEKREREDDQEEDEESQPTAVPRSAFASDLIAASPFYPPTSSSSSQQPPQTSYPSNFNWPPQSSSSSQNPSFRPAPMLGESDAPDLIRDSPDPIQGEGEGEEATARRLKRPSVDLEDGMEGLEVEGGEVSGKEEGGEGDRRKRRA